MRSETVHPKNISLRNYTGYPGVIDHGEFEFELLLVSKPIG